MKPSSSSSRSNDVEVPAAAAAEIFGRGGGGGMRDGNWEEVVEDIGKDFGGGETGGELGMVDWELKRSWAEMLARRSCSVVRLSLEGVVEGGFCWWG